MSKLARILSVCALLTLALLAWSYSLFPPEIEASGYRPSESIDRHLNEAPMDNGRFYGRSPWSGAHRDNRNSDYIPLPSPNAMQRTWTGIEGANFFMGPTIGADGKIFATSARGDGHSHLHAYDTRGNLLWKTRPMEDWDDFDSAAYLSAPVTDVDGHLFIPDSNQLWSFDPEGNTRWVTRLEDVGIHGYIFSIFFTHTGHAGAISSDGKVALFDRDTGALAMTLLDLPGVDGLPASPMPPGLWADASIDERLRQDSWDAIFGFNMEVANTPSVHSESGRIFIVANGREPDAVVLYGIDVSAEGLSIAFETGLGRSGSGTSPTLSFDDRFVYVIDGEGYLNGIDTNTGAVAWKSSERAVTGVSSTSTPSGRIFTFDLNTLVCWDGSNGDVLWKRDLRELAAEEIPWWARWYGKPHASLVSGIMAAADGIWAIASLGTAIPLPEERQSQIQPPIASLDLTTFAQPVEYFLVHYDYEGNLRFRTPFVDAGALLAMGLDGRMYVTTLGINSSIAYYGANPEMPFFMRNTPRPHGGLIAYEPVSFLDYFLERIEWNRQLLESLGDAHGQAATLRDLHASMSSVHLILDEAADRGEVDEETRRSIMDILEGVDAGPNPSDLDSELQRILDLATG
ncbi:MAG: PQQ-binding-like beta-propeller repeat protein [Gammaproteobacteria bacterium]|nr:PQQ-binding-like beta-propeller repeat protein [Gammaproteobacteria bacterium]